MASNVNPEEERAIFDALTPAVPPGPPGPSGADARPPDVAPRDFTKPDRLGPKRLDELASAIRRELNAAEKELGHRLRGKAQLELIEVGEVSCEQAFSHLENPLAGLRFEIEGAPGWAIWDAGGAVAAVEVALGASEEEAQSVARPFSPIEKVLLGEMLESFANTAVQAVEAVSEDPRFVTRREDLGTWRDGGERADPQRFFVHLSCEGPGGPSSVRILVPGVYSEENENKPPPVTEIPPHLADVEVTMTAWLGAAEVPLGDLLDIEVGDVIPLDIPVDAPVQVRVEDIDCATADLGDLDGNLAIRIDGPIEPPDTTTEDDPPSSTTKP